MFKIHDLEANREGFTMLTNIGDNMEMELVKFNLDGADIKFLERRKGSGSYLNVVGGFNFQGVDILVHESDYEKAVEVIKTLNDNEALMSEEAGIEESEEDMSPLKDKRTGLMLLFIVPIVLVAIAAALSSLLS